ncbi:hypothetical protein GJ496_011530 [Pomphorhynchus laevis]|nr:hypothetical protein GJ496_011530 [Pomphorhynchus laevis]
MEISRVFIKDLPNDISDKILRKRFDDCGTITDVRLLYRRDGGFRRIATIGFKNSEEAQVAIKRNNRSFINNSRITERRRASEASASESQSSGSRSSGSQSSGSQSSGSQSSGSQSSGSQSSGSQSSGSQSSGSQSSGSQSSGSQSSGSQSSGSQSSGSQSSGSQSSGSQSSGSQSSGSQSSGSQSSGSQSSGSQSSGSQSSGSQSSGSQSSGSQSSGSQSSGSQSSGSQSSGSQSSGSQSSGSQSSGSQSSGSQSSGSQSSGSQSSGSQSSGSQSSGSQSSGSQSSGSQSSGSQSSGSQSSGSQSSESQSSESQSSGSQSSGSQSSGSQSSGSQSSGSQSSESQSSGSQSSGSQSSGSQSQSSGSQSSGSQSSGSQSSGSQSSGSQSSGSQSSGSQSSGSQSSGSQSSGSQSSGSQSSGSQSSGIQSSGSQSSGSQSSGSQSSGSQSSGSQSSGSQSSGSQSSGSQSSGSQSSGSQSAGSQSSGSQSSGSQSAGSQSSISQSLYVCPYVQLADNQSKPSSAVNRPRPWSKYSEGSSAHKRIHGEAESTDNNKKIQLENKNQLFDSLISDVKDDKEFERFLADQNVSLLSKSDKSIKSDLATTETNKKPKKRKTHTSAYKLRIEGIPFKFTEKKLKKLFHPIKLSRIRILHDSVSKAPKGIAIVWLKSESDLNKALILNKTCIGKRYITLHPIINRQVEALSCNEHNDAHLKTDHIGKQAEQLACPSETIICKNIWYGCSENDLNNLMSQFGHIDSIEIPVCWNSKQPKGFAAVTFSQTAYAVNAMNALNGSIFQGRLLKIEPHHDGTASVSNISGAHCWNSLFVSPNVIAERLAKRFNIQKQDVYSDNTLSSLPVRLAAAEADIVDKTKKFLIAHGVQLDVFKNGNSFARSKRILIVKNVNPSELGNLKCKLTSYGPISKWIFPPEGTAGIVEFDSCEDVASLHLRKFCLTKTTSTQSQQLKETSSSVNQQCVVYVKNLNFSTTNEILQAHFEDIGPCKAQIAFNNLNSKKRSMGYGFVTFSTKDHAHQAIKSMQHSSLDGHKLELSISFSRSKNSAKEIITSKGKQNMMEDETATKILVRNIPFQVKEKEIEELFSVFGQLRFVRLPKKLDGGHRGFGFVDYISRKCAKTAFDALSPSTHIFGRRLVLEWAKADDDDILELHLKTARYFQTNQNEKPKSSDLLRSLQPHTEDE